MASEKNFENRVKDFLKTQNVYYLKYWGGGEFTKAGVPDILACVSGFFVGVEIKAPNGRPSALQIKNLKRIHETGGYAVLLYPKDFELFKSFVIDLELGDDPYIRYTELFETINKWYDKYKREGVLE